MKGGGSRRSGFASRVLAVGLACASVLVVCSAAQASATRWGTLEAIVSDNFRTGESNTRYVLESGGEDIPVRPTRLAAEPGDRVLVTGELRDGRIVGEVEATTQSAEPMALEAPRKVAVVLVTFAGDPAVPWDPQETRSKVFTAANSADAFYQEESYGEISLSGKTDANGDVFGWLAVNTPTDACQYTAWRNAADAAAKDASIDLTGYQHVIYAFPKRSSCDWLGLAVIGGGWSMINGNQNVHVIAHELGHNLGLRHAGSWTCFAGTVRVQISDSCAITEYGDRFDAQGNVAARHHSGWNLDRLGILGAENIESVEGSGTYSIHSALQPTTEPTVLRVPRRKSFGVGVTSWYYLEVRETGGIFENFADASTEGVSIRIPRGGSPAETLLLDANPGTPASLGIPEFADAPLGEGQVFDGGPVRITTLAAGAGEATVSVELDEEPPAAPIGLSAGFEPDGVQLEWTPSSDNFGVDRYLIFRDGNQIGVSGTAGFLDSLAPAGEHAYLVYAEDELGNRSDPSEPGRRPCRSAQPPTARPASVRSPSDIPGSRRLGPCRQASTRRSSGSKARREPAASSAGGRASWPRLGCLRAGTRRRSVSAVKCAVHRGRRGRLQRRWRRQSGRRRRRLQLGRAGRHADGAGRWWWRRRRRRPQRDHRTGAERR